MKASDQFQICSPQHFGAGVSATVGKELKAMGCNKALVFHGKSVGASGIPAKLVEHIREAGLDAVTNDEVEPDPTDAMIDRVAAFAKKEKVDGIVAVGGGSCMDAAKGIKILLNNPGETSIRAFFDLTKPQKSGIPLITIPTTSGTGSEANRFSMVTDTQTGAKRIVTGYGATPNLSLIDPELVVGVPPAVTAACSFDVLAHAIDSATSNSTNAVTRAVAHHIIELVRDNYQAVYRDGKDLDARAGMHLASTLGGMAIANGKCSVSHAFAHALGAGYHIAHGTCCAIFTPACLEYVAELQDGEIRLIGGILGVETGAGDSPAAAARKVSEAIYRMYRSVDIPNIVGLLDGKAGREDAYAKIIPLAMADINARFCPRALDGEGAKWIMDRTYEMAALG